MNINRKTISLLKMVVIGNNYKSKPNSTSKLAYDLFFYLNNDS